MAEKELKSIYLLLVLAFIAGFLACHIYITLQKTEVFEPKQNVVVTQIIDGDTLVVEGGSRIRLLGINTPEKGQAFYSEAKSFLSNLTLQKTISLEKDVENKDQYDRYLRYIWLNDTLVNLELVKAGLAYALIYEPNIKYQKEIVDAEQEAKTNKLRLWAK